MWVGGMAVEFLLECEMKLCKSFRKVHKTSTNEFNDLVNQHIDRSKE